MRWLQRGRGGGQSLPSTSRFHRPLSSFSCPWQSMASNSEKGAASWKRSLSIKIGRRREANGEQMAAREDEPLSPAAQLFHQPGFRCFVVSIMGFGKPLDVDVIKDGLKATLARHPRFSSVPILDDVDGGKKPRWVPTKVAVEDHIVIPNLLDSSGSGSGAQLPDQVVEDYIASLTTTPMDPTRPLWELHVLNIRTSEAAAVAVLRLHHSLGDGISLLSLLLACTRKASDPGALPTIPSQPRPSPPRPGAKNGSTFTLLLLWIWAFLVLSWNTLVGVAAFTATALFLKDTPTPIARSEGVRLRRKRIVHRTVSLDDVRDIKSAMRCTVNDVLVGVTSAGLSRYLSRRYGHKVDDDDKKKKPLLSDIRVRSTLLVNVRPTPGIHELAELMEGKDKGTRWGNRIGYMVLPFSIGEPEDPLDYVRRGKAVTSKKKKSLEALFTYKSADLIVSCFGMKAAAALCKRVVSNTTLSFSNMVGPIEEIAFYDHPIVYLAPSVYGHPQALTIHFQSYMKKMKLVITADEEEIPDPHQLLDDLAHSLQLIKGAIPSSHHN